ncbi:MAG: site-2 protease family protein [Anaerolineales bacterium]|nr:site-2 protease family protein [Anaerolineales bacterium]
MLFAGLDPIIVLYLLIGLLVAISVHECSHAWVANQLGDPTAKNAGRLSLNPFAHLHPLGTLSLLFLGLGWGKPVPVDASRLRPGPKIGMALVGLGGPVANVLTAALLAIPLRLHLIPFMPRRLGGFIVSYGELVSWVVWLNIAMALFNLIPLTPLDGSRLLAVLLPSRWFEVLARYERYGLVLVLLLIVLERFTQTGFLTRILFPPIEFLWWRITNLTPPFPWHYL